MKGTVARVLLVEASEDGTVGGSHRCLHDIATHLDRDRFTPMCLFYEGNWMSTRLADAGVDVVDWTTVRAQERASPRSRAARGIGRLAAVQRRTRFLHDARVNLVHLNNSPTFADLDWVPAALLAGVPIIAHARGHVVRPGALAARLHRGYRRILAVSDSVRASVLEAGFTPSRVDRVYDGVDVAALRAAGQSASLAAVRHQLGAGDEDILAVMVGNLREWKGQAVVLEALHALPAEMRDRVRLAFVGGATAQDAAYVERLRRMVSESGLTGRVLFAGERQDAAAVMRAADVVVHASIIPEPFGLVVVEAMALGTPVIASRLGGPAETVTAGAGLLFDPRDAGALASHLRTIVESPAERRRLAAGGRARAEAFDILRNTAAIESRYAAVLARAGRAS